MIKPRKPNDVYGLSYSQFVVPLVKAVQEQQQIINEQKKTIEVLHQQFKDQQKEIEAIKRMLDSKGKD